MASKTTNLTSSKCSNCDEIEHATQLKIALKIFNFFYKDCKMTQIVAARKLESISGIPSHIIQIALDITYKEEIVQQLHNEKVDLKKKKTLLITPDASENQQSNNIQNRNSDVTCNDIDNSSVSKAKIRVLDPENINNNFESKKFPYSSILLNPENKASGNEDDTLDSPGQPINTNKNTKHITNTINTNPSKDSQRLEQVPDLPVITRAINFLKIPDISNEQHIPEIDLATESIKQISEPIIHSAVRSISSVKNPIHNKAKKFIKNTVSATENVIEDNQKQILATNVSNFRIQMNNGKKIKIIGVDLSPPSSNVSSATQIGNIIKEFHKNSDETNIKSVNINDEAIIVSINEKNKNESKTISRQRPKLTLKEFVNFQEPTEKWKNLELIYPMNYFPNESLLCKHGDFLISEIRQIILKYYVNVNSGPSLSYVTSEICKRGDLFPTAFKQNEMLKLLLNECAGFYITNFAYLEPIILERTRVYQWRSEYLNNLKEIRSKHQPIFYTWIKIGYTRSALWKNSVISIVSGEPQGFEDEISPVALLHFASEKDGLLTEFSQRILLRDGTLANTHYDKWLRCISELTPDNSIIIIGDYSPLHSKWHTSVPNKSWSKYDIEGWLLEKGLTEPQSKNILHYKLNLSQNIRLLTKLHRNASECGRKLLYLPPHHHELNPIEYLFQDIKKIINGKIKFHRAANNLYDSFDIITEAYDTCDQVKWDQAVKKVSLVEKLYNDATNLIKSQVIKENSYILQRCLTSEVVKRDLLEESLDTRNDENNTSITSTNTSKTDKDNISKRTPKPITIPSKHDTQLVISNYKKNVFKLQNSKSLVSKTTENCIENDAKTTNSDLLLSSNSNEDTSQNKSFVRIKNDVYEITEIEKHDIVKVENCVPSEYSYDEETKDEKIDILEIGETNIFEINMEIKSERRKSTEGESPVTDVSSCNEAQNIGKRKYSGTDINEAQQRPERKLSKKKFSFTD